MVDKRHVRRCGPMLQLSQNRRTDLACEWVVSEGLVEVVVYRDTPTSNNTYNIFCFLKARQNIFTVGYMTQLLLLY